MGFCKEGTATFAAARGALGARPWLHFEADWTAAVLHDRLGLLAWKGSDERTAAVFWKEVLAICEDSRSRMKESPVNDHEGRVREPELPWPDRVMGRSVGSCYLEDRVDEPPAVATTSVRAEIRSTGRCPDGMTHVSGQGKSFCMDGRKSSASSLVDGKAACRSRRAQVCSAEQIQRAHDGGRVRFRVEFATP